MFDQHRPKCYHGLNRVKPWAIGALRYRFLVLLPRGDYGHPRGGEAYQLPIEPMWDVISVISGMGIKKPP